MLRMMSATSGRLYGTLLRFLVVRGDLAQANGLRRPRNWQVHAGDALDAEAERLAAAEEWNGARELVAEMRRYAEAGDAPTVAAFADWLEGRAASANGDPDVAVRSLERAAATFEKLSVPWERALTDLDVARVAWSERENKERGARVKRAAATFEQVGDVQGVAAARALVDQR
jgi:hypothetical protein